MDAARVFLGREEERQHARQRHPGVRHTNEHLAGGGRWLGHEDRGGLALFGSGEVSGVLSEREFAGSRAVGGRKASKLDRAVAHDFALDFFGNLSGSE